MRAAAPQAIPRADAPWGPAPGPRGFPDAGPSTTGLKPAFLLLQAYLLLSVSAVDEHYAALGRLRPRLILGLLVLTVAVVKGVQAKLAAGEGLSLRHVPSRWLTAFLVTGVFSTLWAYDAGTAKDAFVVHALAVLSFMLIVSLVHTRREFLLTLLTFCAGAGIYILLSLWEWFHGRHDFTMGVVRMEGAGSMYRDPNSFGATIVFMVPIFVWVGLHATSKLYRLGVLAYLAILAYCAFKTSSRSTLVLTVLAALWTIAALPKAAHRALGVLMLVVAGTVLVSTLSPSQIKRIESVVNPETYEREGSTVGRIEGYRVGFEIAKREPLLGVGPGNWSAYRQRKLDGRVLLAHNLLGSLLAERGFLGGLAFLGFLWTAIALAWRTMRRLRRSADGWDRAVGRFGFATLCTYGLLLVSGLGAHNLDRPNWYAAAALMIVAVGSRRTQDVPTSTETA